MALPLCIAKNVDMEDVVLLPQMANRHGLISGATGSGKTVTLHKIAEAFSSIGVPVFVADVKGDLSGIAMAIQPCDKLSTGLNKIGVTNWKPSSNPTVFWDVFGEKGHPIRATPSNMGPLLFSRLLNLTEVQSGLLQVIFRIANDHRMPLLSLKDLRIMTQFVAEHTNNLKPAYGNIATTSIGAIQRSLLILEEQKVANFLGEPMLDLSDFIRTDYSGKGIINILMADKLYNMPKLYAITLLWMLSELFDKLPEEGDLEKPKLVFFFDEAHLLFSGAPKVLLEKIERVVRLIRSKGVGIYFITQNPLDVPEEVLGQLGNRVQHALRAFTPRDQKAVKAAAQTMRANSAFNTEQAIQDLGTGEALISFLDEKGSPSVVQRCSVIAPGSRLGPVTANELNNLINKSALNGKYEKATNREPAYDMRTRYRADKATLNRSAAENTLGEEIKTFLFGSTDSKGEKHDGLIQKAAKTAVRNAKKKIMKEIKGGYRR